MTNAEYHAHPAISKSDLDLIHRSPLHYKTAQRSQTKAMLMGSVVHKLVLERDEFGHEFAIAPSIDRHTKIGKDEWAKFVAESDGKTVITPEMYNKAMQIADSALSHPAADRLLKGGKAEQSYFWTDSETGVECKCRPDYIRSDILIDIKTTTDASPEAFTKAAYNYRYHVQAAWYLRGVNLNGYNIRDFVFIAVEKEPPYAVCIYAADDLMRQLGEREATEDIRVYAECLKSGVWHGYDKGMMIHGLSLPDYIIRREFI